MSDIRIQIPAELFAPAESSHFEGIWDLQTLQAGPDCYSFAQPVQWHADVTNTGDALLVTGLARGTAITDCARCLEQAEFDLAGEIQGYFLIQNESEVPEDMEGDEFDTLSDDHVIDMAPLVQAALLVDLPLVPLCVDDCKGLCPRCGANLNEGSCGCDSADEQPFKENPFAVLKDYDFGE